MYACICGKPSPGLAVLPGAEGVRPELYVLTPYVARDGILTKQTKEPPRRSSLVGLTILKLRVSSSCRMREGFDQSFTGHLATLYGQRWHTDESDKRTPARPWLVGRIWHRNNHTRPRSRDGSNGSLRFPPRGDVEGKIAGCIPFAVPLRARQFQWLGDAKSEREAVRAAKPCLTRSGNSQELTLPIIQLWFPTNSIPNHDSFTASRQLLWRRLSQRFMLISLILAKAIARHCASGISPIDKERR